MLTVVVAGVGTAVSIWPCAVVGESAEAADAVSDDTGTGWPRSVERRLLSRAATSSLVEMSAVLELSRSGAGPRWDNVGLSTALRVLVSVEGRPGEDVGWRGDGVLSDS